MVVEQHPGVMGDAFCLPILLFTLMNRNASHIVSLSLTVQSMLPDSLFLTL
jgi:hypothetical protein